MPGNAFNAYHRLPRPLRWVIGVAAVLLLLLLSLALIDWNALRGPLGRMLSHRLERRVVFGGPLRVHLFSFTPSVDVQDLTVGNPAWAGGGNMIDLPRLHVAAVLSQLFLGRLVLQTLELDDPSVALVRDQGGRANWDFTGNEQPKPENAQPTHLPPLRHFALRGGNLKIDDATRKLTFDGTVGAAESDGGHSSQPFRLSGQGTLNKEPFKLDIAGDALLDIKLDRPYHFHAGIDAGGSSAAITASIAKPFDFGALDAELELKGQNLANLYYLTNLALPLTPPYQLSVRLQRKGNHFALDEVAGKIGSSDIEGHGTVDLAAKDSRPRLTASITSRSLNMSDLGVAFGAGVAQPEEGRTPSQAPAPSQQPISPLLLPTFEFQFDRLRSMDAAVDFRADSIQAQALPLNNVAFALKLDHGDLTIDPIDFQLPAGKLDGQIRLNTSGGAPLVNMDIRLQDIHLEQFKSKTATESPMQGVLQGRLRLAGQGNSVHAVAANANGTLSTVLAHGEMRAAFAELLGIDAVRGLGLLLASQQQTAIRCGIISFDLKDGDAQTQRLLLDTQNVLISGDGHVTLGDEKLDLNLRGAPKDIRLGRIRAPINIRGTLRHPDVSLSTPALIKQGAVAAGLAVVATPIAAVLAFIDPGLAKDADCAALTDQAQDQVAQPQEPQGSRRQQAP